MMRSLRKRREARHAGGGARLGQHFLTGQWAAHTLAESVNVRPDETILEIGPGTGALTRELLATGAEVVAIEKDETLAAGLEATCAADIESGRLQIVTGDVRDITPERLKLKKYVVAANIPYYITGEIIRQFLSTAMQPRAMALLIQKEVAQRIVTREKESILSLSVKAYGEPKIIAKVSRGNFSPPPSVDSAILLIDRISKDLFASINEKIFFDVVHAGFAAKRKFLANNLAVRFGKDAAIQALAACGLGEKVRAEDVALGKWFALAEYLSARGSGSKG